jgi:predicted transcriptional regulator
MPTSVLLSIKPYFANAILEGAKTFELRRAIFRSPTVRKIVIYASSPVCRVIGEFFVGDVLELELKQLWLVTSKGSCVDRELFYKYFRGRQMGFALKVNRPRRYIRPIPLREHCGLSRPPQSFCYLT